MLNIDLNLSIFKYFMLMIVIKYFGNNNIKKTYLNISNLNLTIRNLRKYKILFKI